ncbi:M10 family metallopeptidase [Microvirga sp. 2YAF29]|uniref:M10 family metallopeptidase n=1 Tax=Microvirga sp. 2YAF29 TaxID=3233031 RepID=UPI003F9A7B95
MPDTSTLSRSGSAYVDALLSDVKWATNRLTYSFPTSASQYGAFYGEEPANGFGAFNTDHKAAAFAALKLYTSVSNLTFQRVTETGSQHAELRYALSNEPYTAWAYSPSSFDFGGDVWLNKAGRKYDDPIKGTYAFMTIVHETGHALGLEHPHEGLSIMPWARDSLEYTVMSYRSYAGASVSKGYVNEELSYPQSLMMYDIAAIQHMYGANYATNSGNTTYAWLPATGEMLINGHSQGKPGGNRIFQSVWDGNGVDTYDFSRYATALSIDLNPGAWTKASVAQRANLEEGGRKIAAGNIANALLYNDDPRSFIEKAIGGSGRDVIKGNAAANILQSGSGNDTLYGRGGNDKLYGGSGNDKLFGQGGADVLIGGKDADTFVFRSTSDSYGAEKDVIRDFLSGIDHIDLRRIDADVSQSGNQAFIFIGQNAFGDRAGELRFAGGIVAGDVNGDGIADLEIVLAGISRLVRTDFYL